MHLRRNNPDQWLYVAKASRSFPRELSTIGRPLKRIVVGATAPCSLLSLSLFFFIAGGASAFLSLESTLLPHDALESEDELAERTASVEIVSRRLRLCSVSRWQIVNNLIVICSQSREKTKHSDVYLHSEEKLSFEKG